MKSKLTSLPEHILINGDFLCRSLTGIERFAYETCIKLDSLLESLKSAHTAKTFPYFSILLPHNANVIPSFKNIQIILSEKEAHSFPVWEHFVFGPTAGKLHSLPLDFANVTPVFHPGIVVIHDIYAKLYPHDFTGRRDKLIRLYMCFMYRYDARHAKKIITV